MGYVKINRDLSSEIAKQFGPEITRIAAEEYARRVKAKAAARFPKVARHVDVEILPMDQDHRVQISVEGKSSKDQADSPDVATALTWGYVNSRSHEHVGGTNAFRASRKNLI